MPEQPSSSTSPLAHQQYEIPLKHKQNHNTTLSQALQPLRELLVTHGTKSKVFIVVSKAPEPRDWPLAGAATAQLAAIVLSLEPTNPFLPASLGPGWLLSPTGCVLGSLRLMTATSLSQNLQGFL